MEETKPLLNKKILFLSPAFFGYEKKIKNEMEKMGAEVKLYDERSVSSSFSRALLKLSPSLFSFRTKKYYQHIIKDNQDTAFDFILIVRCDMVTESVLALLKKQYPNAKLCLHLWDSLDNIKGIRKKIKFFDYVTSFDRVDCLKNDSLIFRPLFFTDDFSPKTTNKKYDLCFCGTIHSDRYYIIKRLFNDAEKEGLKTYSFAYLQGKFIYFYYKFFAKGFMKSKKEEFSFEKKSLSEISAIENSSNVILDIQHPRQTGLTMRTIEMVGAKKKFITTNQEVKEYDFYNPNNIAIIDRNNPEIVSNFFKTEYIDIDEGIRQKYCLKQWISDVLGIGEQK